MCDDMNESQLRLAEALVENAYSREQLLVWANAIWPFLDVYRGNTHWRFFTDGEVGGPSFYLDLFGYSKTARQQKPKAPQQEPAN